MSVGNEELRIVASHNLGEVGAKEAKPTVVQWRWFDGKPTLPLWIGLLVLLVVPKENHKWQAWLILVVPLLACALRLFYLIPSWGASAGFDLMLQFIVTFAIAWAAVWLLAPYLSKGSRPRALALALAVMVAVGTVGYLAYFGFSSASDTLVSAVCFWTGGCLALLLALGLSGACCRGRFHPGLIAVWLMLWLPLFTAIGMVVTVLSTLGVAGVLGPAILLQVVLSVMFGSLFMSGALYALNLPVLLLAGLTDCYGERLRAMVYREPAESEPIGQSPFADGNPFAV